MATDAPTNDPHVPQRSGGVSQTASSARSRPSGAQSQNVQDAHQALDQAADRILGAVKSHLEENKVPGIIKVLERILAPEQPVSVRTRRRCFRGLVEVCGKYGILPDSHAIPGSKIGVVGDGPISSGEFSEVWEGEYKDNDETKRVAIKVVRRFGSCELRKLEKDFCREVIVWKRLSHENILQLIGATMEGGKYRMVSPWMENGNIVGFLRKNYETNPNPLKLLAEAARGVQYLHSLDLAHGDLKGRNILISPEMRALLTDVGFTRITSDVLSISTATTTSTTSFAGDGTIRWAPLELLDPERCGLKKNSGPTKKSDMYSMAMTIYEVLTDKIPFHEYKDPTAVLEITRGARPKEPPFDITRGYTQELWDMGTTCWNPDPAKRLGIDHVLSTLEVAAGEWKPRSVSIALGPDPSGGQPPNMPPTLDGTVNQILVEAGLPPGEVEARRVTEMLEKELGSCHDMGLETRRGIFQRLVKVCGEHSILPNSCIIPEPKLQKQDDTPVSSGGSSVVWRGVYMWGDNDKRRDVAIKVMRYFRAGNVQKIRKSFCREVIAWRCLSHPNILEFLGATLEGEHSVVSPWMENGNIIQFLKKDPQANPLKLLADAARGLQYLHNMGLAHCDVKGANILITDEGSARLADFGLTRPAGDLDPLASSDTSRVGGCGSIRWCPLEILDPEGPSLSTKSDIYSMGMTIYEVLADKIPFYEYTSVAVIFQIAHGERPKKPDFNTTRGYTQELWDMGMSCWNADPTKRPTINDVLNTLEITTPRWRPKHEKLLEDVKRLLEQVTKLCRKISVAKKETSQLTELCSILTNHLSDRPSASPPPDYDRIKRPVRYLSSVHLPLRYNDRKLVEVEEGLTSWSKLNYPKSLMRKGAIEAGVAGFVADLQAIQPIPTPPDDLGPEKQVEIYEAPLRRLDGEIEKTGKAKGAYGDHETFMGEWTIGGGEGTVMVEKVILLTSSSSEKAHKELRRWANLPLHDNILPFCGITKIEAPLYVVLPWCENGNLLQYVKKTPQPDKKRLLRGSAAGLSFLHSRGIIHGSVKCKNVLVSDQGEAQIWNFEMARIGDEAVIRTVSSGDTVRYGAPELIETYGTPPTMESDTYSFTLMVLECVTEERPFFHLERDAAVVHARIAKRQLPPRPPKQGQKEPISDELWNLMTDCWNPVPKNRPTMEVVQKFFVGYQG